MEEKHPVATISVNLIKALPVFLIEGFEDEGLIVAQSYRGLSLSWREAVAELS